MFLVSPGKSWEVVFTVPCRGRHVTKRFAGTREFLFASGGGAVSGRGPTLIDNNYDNGGSLFALLGGRGASTMVVQGVKRGVLTGLFGTGVQIFHTSDHVSMRALRLSRLARLARVSRNHPYGGGGRKYYDRGSATIGRMSALGTPGGVGNAFAMFKMAR